jgi:beta-phosphoglucomutase
VKIGIAFDLDGTLIDNNPYHILAWQEFYRKRGRTLDTAEYNAHFNGRTNADVVRYVFEGQALSDADIFRYTDEKESLYRELYAPVIQPVAGLIRLLESLQQADIPMVIATSGIVPNIEFMFEHLPLRKYFRTVINSTHIKHGKPHPEIYQKAAAAMELPPANCIAFEDAHVGIASAKDAGMKVVALTTTHTADELTAADLVISDFTEITTEKLIQLLHA